MSDSKITVIDGGAKPNPDLDLVRKITKDWESHVKLADLDASLKKLKYDAYIKAGFTPEQALNLIK